MRAKKRTTMYQKRLVCKKTKIPITSSTNLLYSISAHAKMLHRSGAENNEIEKVWDVIPFIYEGLHMYY